MLNLRSRLACFIGVVDDDDAVGIPVGRGRVEPEVSGEELDGPSLILHRKREVIQFTRKGTQLASLALATAPPWFVSGPSLLQAELDP